MPQLYRGRPGSTSRFVLPDGRSAVLVPREEKHFSQLQNGYPLTEDFLDYLSKEDVDAIAIDEGDRLYVFDRSQYRHGDRVGHAPYPMKRVAPLDEAALTVSGDRCDAERKAAQWEWLTEDDLRPARERTGRTAGSW